jgi:putative glutamine amidotransferase
MRKIGLVIGTSQADHVEMHRGYVASVLSAGGAPYLIPAVQGVIPHLRNLMTGLDGILLAGGGDIDPLFYGQKPAATLDGLDSARDEAEAEVVRIALQQDIRLLGICRGAQLIAALHGGQLIQDLPSAGFFDHRPEGVTDTYAARTHKLRTNEGTLAHSLFGAVSTVNSQHHQGILDPGKGITATGWSNDGLIEVIEGRNLLGVQWHPELMSHTTSNSSSAVFDWLTRN